MTYKRILKDSLMTIKKLSPSDIANAVIWHFNGRDRVWPTIEDGLLFTETELSEAIELWLARKNYKRNNPDDKEKHTKERFAEELGDIIYMVMITGAVEEINPIDAMFLTS